MTGDLTIDTVKVIETLRDTVVRIDADSSMIQALIECDSLGQAYIRELIEVKSGKRMPPPTIKIIKDTLKIQASADSMAIYLTLKDRYVEHKKSETITNIIEVNRLTLWQKWMYYLGLITLGLTICSIGLKLYKLFNHYRDGNKKNKD